MTFTNTDCVNKNWPWYFYNQVCSQMDSRVYVRVERMRWHLSNKIYPIQYKIDQEIDK